MTRLRSATRFVLHTIVVAALLYTVPWLVGAALAATGDAPVVPPPSADALVAYVQTYGWIVGGLTAIYLGVKWLLKKNESTHWIAQGRALAAITTVFGVGGTALQAVSMGTPWSGVLATAVLGLLHLADAKVTPAPARNSQAGTSFLGCMIAVAIGGLLALALTMPGCTKAQLQADATAAKHALINCTAQAIGTTPGLDLATLVAVVNLAATERVRCTPSGASLDWKCVETDAIAKGETLGGCMLAEMVSGAAAVKSTTSALVAGAPVAPPGRAEFEHFRRTVAGGATYHTAGGDI